MRMGKTNKPQPPLSLEQRRAWLIEHRHPAVDPFWRLNDEPSARTVTVTLRGDRDLPEIIGKAKGEAMEKAVHGVVRPGGDARGKQRSDAADKWGKPAEAQAEEIWREFPDLSVAIVGQRIRKLLPEDNQPPSNRTLADRIRPLKPKK
jgi:hypothetical protein